MQTKHLHALLGIALLGVLPLASRVFGSGFFGWTMYSGSREYRIEIRVKDASGVWHAVAPTGLASRSSRGAAGVLVAADHFRRGPTLAVLRTNLDDLARFACVERSGVEANVVLHERRDATDAERVTEASVACP